MIRIKPNEAVDYRCGCGGDLRCDGLIWQGLHISQKLTCESCGITRYASLPVNQSEIEQYSYFPESDIITDNSGKKVVENWYSSKLRAVSKPLSDDVSLNVEKFADHDDVLILNTLDYVYGHSFFYLLNLQRILKADTGKGVVVILQPMLRWLVPAEGIAEIWTVNLKFRDLNYYHSALTEKINAEIDRFKNVWLSVAHVIPTNENIDIRLFTGIKPYNFENATGKPRITLIWREDPDRLWIRNIFLLKGFKKLGFKKILLPLQYIRTRIIFSLLKRKLGDNYLYTVAGMGSKGGLPTFINDCRTLTFNEAVEKELCKVYSESILVFGVHGSAMLLPSAHAGMSVSMMPSRRWGNYAEDLLLTENDPRMALFQKRIIPLNMSIYDIRDIIVDMITGREQFLKKFIHSDDL